MEAYWENIVVAAQAMSWQEVVAVVFGLLSVWYAKKENILVFPTGIISVLLYVYICFKWKLYADMGVNFYYFVMSVYGWIVWSSRTDEDVITPITKNTSRENLISIVLFAMFFIIMASVLSNYTDSDVPYWDSLTTGIFLVGMWLMAKKKIENWIAWIIGDFISIPLYAYKGLYLTSFQFLVFLGIAIAGYVEWRARIENS